MKISVWSSSLCELIRRRLPDGGGRRSGNRQPALGVRRLVTCRDPKPGRGSGGGIRRRFIAGNQRGDSTVSTCTYVLTDASGHPAKVSERNSRSCGDPKTS